jgi:hypothetical protein
MCVIVQAPLIPKVILDTMAQHKTSDSPPSDNSLAAVGRGVHIFSNSSDQWEVVPSPCQIDGQQGPWETVNRQAGKRDVAASGAASASSKPSPGDSKHLDTKTLKSYIRCDGAACANTVTCWIAMLNACHASKLCIIPNSACRIRCITANCERRQFV